MDKLLEKTGLVSISFRNMTIEELAEESKKAGLSYIEWGSDVHVKKSDAEALKRAAASGIKCSSYGSYFRLGVHDVNELYDYAETAKKLGTDTVRIWAGGKDPEYFTYEEKMKLFLDCAKAAKIGKETGVTFCFECHNMTYVSRLEKAEELLKYADSENIAMYWQPNQFRSVKTNLEYAERIAPYTKIIHVFNWEGNGKYPLAEAEDTWVSYLKCFGENLEKNDVKFLLEFMPDGRIESLKAEAEAAKKILLRV